MLPQSLLNSFADYMTRIRRTGRRWSASSNGWHTIPYREKEFLTTFSAEEQAQLKQAAGPYRDSKRNPQDATPTDVARQALQALASEDAKALLHLLDRMEMET